jgi:hypothetical protein
VSIRKSEREREGKKINKQERSREKNTRKEGG